MCVWHCHALRRYTPLCIYVWIKAMYNQYVVCHIISFLLSVLAVFSLVWLCQCACHMTWQRPHSHALFEVENISQEMFSFFFSAQAGMHTISHVWWSVYEYSVHGYLCDDVCICIFVCVILMMLSPSTLLGCQHGAGECHTHRPPSKSCWDRSFFSVRTDDSRWHQIDPGHVGLIILCLHVSAPCRNTSRHVQEARA